jgi:predicted DNA-binding protein YlxM (UPF0122 family)
VSVRKTEYAMTVNKPITGTGWMNMEKIVEQGLLYDFYGELLTEHQRRIYEDAVMNDMSLSEIAQEAGISRQGVHDLIKRCDKTLEEYESRLHLMEKFRNITEKLEEIKRQASEEAVIRLADEILEEL